MGPNSTSSSPHLPDMSSLLSPHCLPPSAPRPGGKTTASQNGRQARACLRAHVCAHSHAPSARQLPDPREAPVTWCQSYLGNWPFWFRINRGAQPLGFVEKRTVREMLCHLVRQTFFFKFQNYDGIFFWICFMNKPDWSISLLTDCLFVVT